MNGNIPPPNGELPALMTCLLHKYKEQLLKMAAVAKNSICSRIMFSHILSMSFATMERLKLLAKEGLYQMYSAERIDPLKMDFMDAHCIRGLAERYLMEMEYVCHMNGSVKLKSALFRHFAKILCILRCWSLIGDINGNCYLYVLMIECRTH